MGEDSDSELKQRAEVCHQRADHEDILFVQRTNVCIVFNAFLAVAVGIVKDSTLLMEGFAFLGLIVDYYWIRWAPNSQRFIRALRDAGGTRADEVVWQATVGKDEKRISVLTILSVYIPRVLF